MVLVFATQQTLGLTIQEISDPTPIPHIGVFTAYKKGGLLKMHRAGTAKPFPLHTVTIPLDGPSAPSL